MSVPAFRLDGCVAEVIRVRGIVQGVGFRPAVWRLARDHALRGSVRNDGSGVLIEAWGSLSALDRFAQALRDRAPPLARIDAVERQPLQDAGAPEAFRIASSVAGASDTGVAPDAATCTACVAETLDPVSRRYRYAFTNCTHCGPRLTIVRAIPYDRASTSMAAFDLCEPCAAEYADPDDRRFHAQPVACADCGPRLRLEIPAARGAAATARRADEVASACALIRDGHIVAVKGLGGFHLACDATDDAAVGALRARKQRDDKPFALMARDLDVVRRYCAVSEKEAALLASPAAPIVILDAAGSERVSARVAPMQNTLGFMLPYTPLHHLLMQQLDVPIVLTSGNRSDEPQCIANDEARERLAGIADALLTHDRDVVNRVDDSVVRIIGGEPRLLRRARGYAPAPIALPGGFEHCQGVLALGGELKNTFCLIRNGEAVLSQHIGDLEDAATLSDYRSNLELYARLFQFRPERLAADLHPEYLSTKLAEQWSARDKLALHYVQHHHAHIAACLAENGWPLAAGPVLGIALDGLGLGDDGGLWGGELLIADYRGFKRAASFAPVPLIGGAKAMRQPWRNTLAHIDASLGWTAYRRRYPRLELTRLLQAQPLAACLALLERGAHCPPASSCGRLFDAVAGAVGIRPLAVSYEGQAAIELEAAVDPCGLRAGESSNDYPLALTPARPGDIARIDPSPMWRALLDDLAGGVPRGVIAARFHRGLASAVTRTVLALTQRLGRRCPDTVAFSGGVLQNRVLCELLLGELGARGYTVLTHHHVPASDGGLALGQAVVAAARALDAGG